MDAVDGAGADGADTIDRDDGAGGIVDGGEDTA